MNELIKNAILNGRLVLLFGAGASRGCKNQSNAEIPLGGELSRILAAELGEDLNGEDLSEVYSAAKAELGDRVNLILERHFKHCTPSNEFNELAKYPFFRIYTLNIDDAFEKSIIRNSSLNLNVRQRNDSVVESDQFFKTLDYIKLNGDVARLNDGVIFSPQEYGDGSASEPFWYSELAKDFHRYTFMFIGTQLKEPLFYHQISKYKAKSGKSNLKSYLLTPELTNLQKRGLISSNIEHIAGTLKDFTDWLQKELPTPPSSIDIVKNIRPELTGESAFDSKNLDIFEGITPVNRANLTLVSKSKTNSKIRNFYKGFKPNWFDIMDGVPAILTKTKIIYDNFLSNNKLFPCNLYMLFGTAGSGKTTALKQLALLISEESDRNVYFVEDNKNNFSELIKELDYRNTKPYYLFIDRIGDFSRELSEIIKSNKTDKAIFVSSENPSIWKKRCLEHLKNHVLNSMDISEINSEDVTLILDKLKIYGNWTRLQKMSAKNRKLELIQKSKRQLLIGLLETTSGEGYQQIIRNDYKAISDESERSLLILAGLATTQRVQAHEVNLTRALSNLGVNPDVSYVSSNMDGLVHFHNGNVTTRHRVYIENLFKHFVSKEELYKVICAYIKAFSVYSFPIVKNITNSEFSIYKYLVNAKALKKLFIDDKDKILSIYEKFEKAFENEGLFLMQYGLALRSFGENEAAYEKLRIAEQAFPESPHIEHALAQQRIILACHEKDETIALSYFSDAETVLNRLNNSRVSPQFGGTDRYPMITLSEGHVKMLDNLGHIQEAKIIAKGYFDRISNNPDLRDNSRIKGTLNRLMKYSLNGTWQKLDNDDF